MTTPAGLAGGAVTPPDACAAGRAGADAEQPATTMATAVSATAVSATADSFSAVSFTGVSFTADSGAAPPARLVPRLNTFVPRLHVAVVMPRPHDPAGGQLTTVARSCETAASPATPTALPQLTTTRGQPTRGPTCRPGSVEMPNVSPGQIEDSP